ncbi:YmfL family putative regulatory protein [Collimonas sp. OK412]|uniref:YmfL family putative regulatory protein n=1 Tax=Collimonas sp. (strain OK412) TaxID=1801619 RepID=UPI0008E5BF22|nr:YmfL family putative regulatory protein [Collimonas sp. OK412]SFD03408.1 hypothetical protein SAMN04515619_12018 [Collimonas sp. OK412]
MNLRQSYLGMIKAFSGGWDAMCGALGYSRDALENRIYEKKGQSLWVETALQMQSLSGTTLFAEAVATASGGVFVTLPAPSEIDNEALLSKFNKLHTHIGLLSRRFNEATEDGEIDKRERADLAAIGDEIHRHTQELLALTFRIYCRGEEEKVAA